MQRRDLLKLFGVGATIVPVIGGVPELEAPAKLIELPSLEPVKLAPWSGVASIPKGLPQKGYITVDFFDQQQGHHWRIRANSLVISSRASVIDVTSSINSPYREFMPDPEPTIEWELKGVCTGTVKFDRR